MRSWILAIILGVLLWLVVFAVSFVVYPLKANPEFAPLFESIMPVAISLCTMVFLGIYFRKVRKAYLFEGIMLGVLWFVINVAIDAALMWFGGPMKMPILDYFMDIGLTYVMIPAMTIGVGIVLAMRK